MKKLARVECLNPHLTEDSDELWKNHCIHDYADIRRAFNDKSLDIPIRWRDLYMDKESEIQEKEANLSKKLRALKNQESIAKQERNAKILEPKLVSSSPFRGKLNGIHKSIAPSSSFTSK